MTDPLAVNARQSATEHTGILDNDTNPSLQPVRPRYVRFARYVSNILAPASISFPLVILIALYQARSFISALLYSALTLFFLSIGPFLYILIGVRLGKLSDVDVSKRTERLGPFIFGLLSVCLGWFALVLTHAPAILITCVIITAVSGLIMMVTTLWWKISIHASTMGAAATILTVLYGGVMLPTFGLLILVSWSRVVLRRHTVSQVVAGSLLSIALTALMLKIGGF